MNAHAKIAAAIERDWNIDYGELQRLCAIIGSHCVSANEAAWRGDRELAHTHLRHAREALILALKLSKD